VVQHASPGPQGAGHSPPLLLDTVVVTPLLDTLVVTPLLDTLVVSPLLLDTLVVSPLLLDTFVVLPVPLDTDTFVPPVPLDTDEVMMPLVVVPAPVPLVILAPPLPPVPPVNSIDEPQPRTSVVASARMVYFMRRAYRDAAAGGMGSAPTRGTTRVARRVSRRSAGFAGLRLPRRWGPGPNACPARCRVVIARAASPPQRPSAPVVGACPAMTPGAVATGRSVV
jgi:hypothetical protein